MKKRKMCVCGCGMKVKDERRFVHGHHRRGIKWSKSRRKKQMATIEANRQIKYDEMGIEPPKPNICGCGCKGRTSPGKTFIHGHAVRLRPKKILERRLCKCGCGGQSSPGSTYISGHNSKSREAKIKLSISNSGTKSGKWEGKGGWDSKKVHPYLTRFEYVDILGKVKSRDRNACVICGETLRRLHIHHVVPSKLEFADHLCDHESNLITLCGSCHGSIEAYGLGLDTNRWKKFLPFAKEYLLQFEYKEMLLNRYI